MHRSMKIILASNNEHKRMEIERLFSGNVILLPSDIGVQFHYKETGRTYLENAMGKAKHLYEHLYKNLHGSIKKEKYAILADDSGLSVDALDGAPGIRSARYGNTTRLSDAERNEYLLKKLEGLENRKAHFICCMVLMIEHERFYIVQEKLDGFIGYKPVGDRGFGYDPLFYIPEKEKTLAELSMEEKNSISHRGRASKMMLKLIND